MIKEQMLRWLFIISLASLLSCGDSRNNDSTEMTFDYRDWPGHEYSKKYQDRLNEVDRLMAIEDAALSNVDMGDTEQLYKHMDEIYRLIELEFAIVDESLKEEELKVIQQRRKEMRQHYPSDTKHSYVGQ